MFEPNESHLLIMRQTRARLPVSGMSNFDYESHVADLAREGFVTHQLGGPKLTALGNSVLDKMGPRE